MLLVEVNISKIAFFIAAQNFSQVVTKFITCDDVTRFDGISTGCVLVRYGIYFTERYRY